jgi:hypothetical protein
MTKGHAPGQGPGVCRDSGSVDEGVPITAGDTGLVPT